jgi:hypothetical protein
MLHVADAIVNLVLEKIYCKFRVTLPIKDYAMGQWLIV